MNSREVGRKYAALWLSLARKVLEEAASKHGALSPRTTRAAELYVAALDAAARRGVPCHKGRSKTDAGKG